MNKKLKSQLKTVFDVSDPMRKAEFLQSINYPKTSLFDFILGQISYIRKKIWIISCLLIIAAFFGLRCSADDNSLGFVRIISSVLPFISLMTITEIARSASYNMAELEMSCTHNFAGVTLARLGILGVFNIIIFGAFILLFHGKISFSLFRTGVYLLVPFMFTCALSLFTINSLRSRETTYICGVISCFTGIANAIFTSQYKMAFSDKYMIFWILIFVITAVFAIKETVKLIKKTEEPQWNLS